MRIQVRAGVLLALLVISACSAPASERAQTATAAPATPDPAEVAAARVIACEQAHGLSQAHDKVAAPQGTVFASCDWPRPAWADPDGYTGVAAQANRGPGQSEADGTTVATLFTFRCRVLRVDYVVNYQGAHSAVPPIYLAVADIVTTDGRRYTGLLSTSPGPNQAVVLSNSHVALALAACNS